MSGVLSPEADWIGDAATEVAPEQSHKQHPASAAPPCGSPPRRCDRSATRSGRSWSAKLSRWRPVTAARRHLAVLLARPTAGPPRHRRPGLADALLSSPGALSGRIRQLRCAAHPRRWPRSLLRDVMRLGRCFTGGGGSSASRRHWEAGRQELLADSGAQGSLNAFRLDIASSRYRWERSRSHVGRGPRATTA
jgi:hypothetical protein